MASCSSDVSFANQLHQINSINSTNFKPFKTCGTTTLLMIVPILIQECKAMQLIIDNVLYSRSNFMFLANQPQLHRLFDNEVAYLNEYFDGYGVVLGSLNQARWHCYHTNHDTKSDGKTLEIVLFDLDDACMEYYFKNALHDVDLDAWIMNGCGIPCDTMIDSYAFEPCGYSLNGIPEDKYCTIHITPEKEASFVSFETNYDYDTKGNGYTEIIQKVIQFFAPKRFSFAMNSFGEERVVTARSFDGFELSDASDYKFSKYHEIRWSNFENTEVEKGGGKDALDVKDNSKSLWTFIHSEIAHLNL
eukprot:1090572_1